MATNFTAAHPLGITHIPYLPSEVYMRIFNTIAETRGSDTFRTIRRFISAYPGAFRIFQVDRARILVQVLESLIAQSPNVWKLERVQEMALVVASVPPRSAYGPVLTYQEIAGYISRFQALSEALPENQVPTRRAFRAPSDIDTLARLVGVISPITPFLIRVDNNMTYTWPENVLFRYTWVSQEEKMLKSYLLESELWARLHGRGRAGCAVATWTREYRSWSRSEQDSAQIYDDFIEDGFWKLSQTDHPIGYGRIREDGLAWSRLSD